MKKRNGSRIYAVPELVDEMESFGKKKCDAQREIVKLARIGKQISKLYENVYKKK